MKNFDLAGQTRKTPSIAQEMRQAFADWVDKLPSMKKEIPKDTAPADPQEKSLDKATAPHTPDRESAEPPPDHEGKSR